MQPYFDPTSRNMKKIVARGLDKSKKLMSCKIGNMKFFTNTRLDLRMSEAAPSHEQLYNIIIPHINIPSIYCFYIIPCMQY